MAPVLKTQKVISAGGVVLRPGQHDVEVLMCGRNADGLWALPKGTPEEGETLNETALREVEEETGVGTEISALIGDIRYWFSRPEEGVRYLKTVRHFLMRPVSGDVSLHDHEFDEVQWIPAQEALKLLTHKNEARILRQALEVAEEKQETEAS